jgi:hypothetical protein
MFGRLGFVGKDLETMWRWLREGTIDLDSSTTQEIHPHALRVQPWLAKQHSATSKTTSKGMS